MRKKTHAEFLEDIGDIAEEYVFFSEYDGIDKKFEVLHKTCGNIYDVRPSSIIKGHLCRYCAGSAKITQEQCENKIRAVLGEGYTVLGEYRGRNRKIKLYHDECGRTYEVYAYRAMRGTRCAKCSGNLIKTQEEVSNIVHTITDGEYILIGEYRGNKQPMDMIHTECGTIFSPTYNNFVSKNSRCPTCRSSNGERRIKDTLDELGIEYEREKRFPGLGRYRFDFYLVDLNMCIEFDGEHHFESVEFWGGKDYLKEVQNSDTLKNEWCRIHEIDLVRIPYWEEDLIPEIVKRLVGGRLTNENEMGTK